MSADNLRTRICILESRLAGYWDVQLKLDEARSIAEMQALCLAELRNEPAELMPWEATNA